MKNLKRTFVALLLLFSLCLSACSLADLPFELPFGQGNDPVDDNPTDDPNTDPTPTSKPIDAVIVPEDEISTCYYVVYASANSNLMAKFIPEMMSIYGLQPNYFIDTETEETKYEILLGNTNRALSAELIAAVNERAEADGGLTWGYACRDGQFAIYATSAKAYDGTTSWEKCWSTLKRTYMLKDSFIVDTGTLDIQNISQATLDAQKAEEDAKANAERAVEINAMKATIDNNMGKTANAATTTANYKKNFGTRKTIASAAPATPTAYPAANTHPRLEINSLTLEKMKTEVTVGSKTLHYYNYGENESAYKGIVSQSDSSAVKSASFGILGAGNADQDGFNCDFSILERIEACAFRYALEHEEGTNAAEIYGYRAINGILNFLKTVNYGSYSLKYRSAGETMYVAAEVYDWCYDLLTDDMKNNIVNAVTSRVIPEMEITRDASDITPNRQAAVAGHGAEAQVLRDWFSFSIAVYDEFPEYYNYIAGKITADYVPFRNAYYESCAVGQGNSYGIYRFNFDIDAALFFETMQCTENPVKLFSFSIENVALGLVYNTRPDDQLLHIGDEMNERLQESWNMEPQYLMDDYARTMFYAYAATGNGVLKSEAYHFTKSFTRFDNEDNTLTRVHLIIYNDPTVLKVSKDTLDLSMYYPYPAGILISRNGWGEDAAMVYMKIGERFTANHEHRDFGSFQIFYHGQLAIDAGFYDNYSSSVESHNRSSLAHNVLLINHNNQDTNGSEPNNFDAMGVGGTVIGEDVINDESGNPLYAYLAGNMTEIYKAAYATEVGRYMLAVYNYDADGNPTGTPLAFFVMDDVKTSQSKEIEFLLQPMQEPEVSGNVVKITNTVEVINYWNDYDCDGVLVDQAFVDDGTVTIDKLAGRYGTSNPTSDGRWLEDLTTVESGWGRVEIKTTGTNTKMLNVMYVTDTATDEAQGVLTASKYSNDNVMGASIPALGVAAFFNKNVTEIDTATVKGEGEGTVRYSVCGMAAGTYAVKDAASITVATVTVTEESGLLTFTAPAGTYTITK